MMLQRCILLVHIFTLFVRLGCFLLSHCVCPQSITRSLRRQLGLVLCVWGVFLVVWRASLWFSDSLSGFTTLCLAWKAPAEQPSSSKDSEMLDTRNIFEKSWLPHNALQRLFCCNSKVCFLPTFPSPTHSTDPHPGLLPLKVLREHQLQASDGSDK